MRNWFPLLVGAALLILAAIANSAEFLADFKTGVLIGAGFVAFLLYPAYLRNHERRLAALERQDRLRDTPREITHPRDPATTLRVPRV